ncbi:MAG: MoaD/ThiS family protein [Nanoarchaeota archaeon]|nr:MoaD/ThiS family protein [Nanoarchaeota archaeon]MBU1631802.1 MoaD/ThiS family protein [Nanoarchaeota archaeon]MBU1876594.1 MoaD/ThiS family protein [Nanoarchaeota archaeon]
MELKIFDEREQTTKTIQFRKKTVKELLLQLDINPETVIVTKDNEVITEEELLKDKDRLEILSVISGG